jgi:hypothetical protein
MGAAGCGISVDGSWWSMRHLVPQTAFVIITILAERHERLI